MSTDDRIRTAFERNIKAVTLRPRLGQGTAVTRVRLGDGLACQAEDGRWNLTVDMSEKSGGDASGPDPGVMGRSALGSCLAIAYKQWAVKAGVAIDAIEIEIQADYDVRGQYGIGERSPAYERIRFVVTVESDAAEQDVLRAMEKAETNCPYLHVFKEPQELHREVRVVTPRS